MRLQEYYFSVQVLTVTEYQKPQIAHIDQNVGQLKNMARWRSMHISHPDFLKMGENM